MCNIEWKGKKFAICGVYGPNKDSPGFWQNIFEKSQTFHDQAIIIGDFNVVLDETVDKLGHNSSNNRHPNSQQILHNRIEHLSMTDVWRSRNNGVKRYSWYRTKPTLIASRIDYALVSLGLVNTINQCLYMHGLMTDHSAMYLSIECENFDRGTGYWKFNNMHLQNAEFVQYMNRYIEEQIDYLSSLGPKDRWENLKFSMIKECKNYAINTANEKSLIIAQLTEYICEMEENLSSLAESDIKILDDSKADLESFVQEKMIGRLFRSRAQWQCEGERNTKYFYNLERRRANAKSATAIYDACGNLCTNKNSIMEAQKIFYQNLYTEEEGVSFNIVNTTNVVVPEGSRAASEDVISKAELTQALKELKNQKSPGPDGLTADFYKMFWVKLQDVYHEAITEAYSTKEMYGSVMRGIINVIPKPGKDSRYMNNVRPITLLNTDYKIIEKALANRMLDGLQHVIHEDQKGFMPGRRLSTNIRRVFDLMDYTKMENIDAFILSLDFAKCFDKISFSALKGSLRYFGCSNVIREWTDILYKGFTVKVHNYGHLSSKIKLERGIHQGGCASAMYFLYCAEMLSIALRQDNSIAGIPVKEIAAILGQYADDMDNYSRFQQESLNAIIRRLSWFHDNAGFAVNYDKTALYRIGSVRNTDAQLYCQKLIQWTNIGINVLGVYISYDREAVIEQNYRNTVNKIRNILKTWSRRNLSLIGKIEIVNTLIASQFVYKMQVLPNIPSRILNEIESLITSFIWNGNRPKVATKILQMNKLEGGLGLVNLKNKECAIKCSWIQTLMRDELLSTVVYSILNTELQEEIWNCNLNETDIENMFRLKSEFWTDVLKRGQRLRIKS